ncbi:rhodanese-like domain-containing protein [Flagellimonas beolgyonensis]|uniref:rhodanese-like domain-containing protein n=1 Tax=Flagellimonas beolgyonensis TaxID=864064 RepID=UPI000F8C646D|nr:rhodanese-like domain-containing protein [Allomuricauda beolgyonensis]
MKRVIKRLLLLVVFINVFACQSQKESPIQRIDKEAIKTEVIGKDVQLVDVRTPGEYNAGHIDDAVNFDLSDRTTFMKQIETLDKDQPVYLYCLVGSRSGYAAKILRSKGFTQIFDYSGGYNDWIKN